MVKWDHYYVVLHWFTGKFAFSKPPLLELRYCMEHPQTLINSNILSTVHKVTDGNDNSQRQLREMEQHLANVQGQLQEKESQEVILHEQLREKCHQEEDSQRQLRDLGEQAARMEQQLREKANELDNSERLRREIDQQFQRQLREKELQQTSLHEQLREKDQQQENLQRQVREMERQLTEKDEQGDNLQRELSDLEQQLGEKEEQEENFQRQLGELEQQLSVLQDQCQEKEHLQQQVATLQGQLRAKDQEVYELETTLSTAQRALNEQQRHQSPDWVIPRDQIQQTDKVLGRGGWGSVVEGKYCGCAVAVKQIHELILSVHNRNLFEREMNIASRCRHPCLLQFIGATNDEGSPLFVTELMESSLRALLEQRPLSAAEVSIISLDVARALSYLHHKTHPIIHRDISSANVLLWRQGDQWRGKVSDYGTANFMQHTMTACPGARIYMAPEAHTSNQTIKISITYFKNYSISFLCLVKSFMQIIPCPRSLF